jgi:hypothetical protein
MLRPTDVLLRQFSRPGMEMQTIGGNPPAVDDVTFTRQSTSYYESTGRNALELFKRIAGYGMFPVSPELQKMIQMAESPLGREYVDRSYILGIALQTDPNALQAAMRVILSPAFLGDMVTVAPAYLAFAQTGNPASISGDAIARLKYWGQQLAPLIIQDVTLSWGPGKGASVMPVLTGAQDPMALVGIITGCGANVGSLFSQASGLPDWMVNMGKSMMCKGGATSGFGADLAQGPVLLSRPWQSIVAENAPAPPLPSGIKVIDVQGQAVARLKAAEAGASQGQDDNTKWWIVGGVSLAALIGLLAFRKARD